MGHCVDDHDLCDVSVSLLTVQLRCACHHSRTFFVSGVESARGQDCPSQNGVAKGFGLIPVSVQVGGGVEQKEDRPGTCRSDTACG